MIRSIMFFLSKTPFATVYVWNQCWPYALWHRKPFKQGGGINLTLSASAKKRNG